MSFDIKPMIKIAREAGAEILSQLVPNVEVFYKPDNSVYTAADINAHNIVLSELKKEYPGIAVLSEEGAEAEQREAFANSCRFVTDPLDGSKTSVQYAKGKKHEDGFGVHIALLENGQPKWGVVYFPARGDGGMLYYTGNDGCAYLQRGDKPPKRIKATRPPFKDKVNMAVSWREEGSRPSEINGREINHIPEVGGGRVCITADGTTDLAYINSPFSHWDLAAAHAIIRAAGGELVGLETKSVITYDDPSYYLAPCIGGSLETLELLDLANDLPFKTRKIC